MGWEFVFSTANMLAIAAWSALILLPRWQLLMAVLLYMVVGLLCFVYAFSLIGVLGGWLPFGAASGAGAKTDFTTIEGVRALFASDAGVTIGWVHYLAFDLFVGIWIARDGDDKVISRFVQAPILLATFLAGPLGLFIWLLVREPAARRNKRYE